MIDSEAVDMFHKLLNEIIAFKQSRSAKNNDFLQVLVDAIKGSDGDGKERKKPVTLDEVAAEAFCFYTAGYETSAIPMHLCLYELAKHPEVQQKVRKEIEGVLDKNGGNMTYEGVKEMKYLGQVIDGE